MDYDESMEYLKDRQGNAGICLGLNTMRQLMKRLDQIGLDIPCIHIAGTNGKGSASAYLEAIYRAAGYRVGAYRSPAVYSEWEIITCDGEEIDGVSVSEGLTLIKNVADEMAAEGLTRPTAFEIQTALAFWYFAKRHCDIMIVEVGLGGDLDATNVVNNVICSVIMSVSLDHTGILGTEIEQIAAHKAGIIKPKVPCVCYPSTPDVIYVIKDRCDELGSPLTVTDPDARFPWELQMIGEHQRMNACVILSVMDVLRKTRYRVSEVACKEGFANAKLPGRMERLCENPYVYADGAHNPAAVQALVRNMEFVNPDGHWIIVMGVMRDKDYMELLKLLLPKAAAFIAIRPDNTRSLTAAELLEAAGGLIDENGLAGQLVESPIACLNLKDAVNHAMRLAKDYAIPVMACGSFYYLGDFSRRLGQWKAGERD